MKKTYYLIAAFLACSSLSNGQSTSATNNFLPPGKYLGFFNNNLNPLDIRSNNFTSTRFQPFLVGQQLQQYPGAITNPLPGFRLTRVGIARDGLNPILRPLSLVHIGYDFPFAGVAAGFRSWQDIGTMYCSQTDNFWMGLRQKSPGDPTGRTSQVTANTTDANDAVISWGDNNPLNGPAPDDNLTFLFHAPVPNGQPFGSSDYGREVVRMTGIGNVGVGPVFFDNAQPQNMVHVNNNALNQAYVQVSNANGTGQTAGDGFHFGITNGAPPFGAIAQVRNYENSDMQFYTNNQQRMVIKNNLVGNIGRVGINMNTPGNRLTINTQLGDPGNGIVGTPGGSSGIRTTFMTIASPTIANPGNGVVGVNAQGDFIYVPGGVSQSNNGISITPGGVIQLGVTCPAPPAQIAATQLLGNRQLPLNGFNFTYSGLGNVGIGTGCVPNNKLEVDAGTGNSPISGLRLTQFQVPQAPLPTNNLCLSVNNGGDVILTQFPPFGGGFGNLCTAAPNPLTGNFQMPLGTFQYKFTGQGLINNAIKQDIVSVGYPCNINPPSRFSVLENQAAATAVQTYAGYFNNNNSSTPIFTGIPIETAGLFAEAKQNIIGPPNYVNHNIGAIAEATGAINSIGVVGRIAKSSLPIGILGQGRYAIGGAFMSDTSVTNIPSPAVENYGVFASAFNSPVNNFAVYAETGPDPNGIASSYAVFARTTGPNPSFPGPGGNFAGYFDGDVVRTGADNFSSDAILKQNIDSIPNALSLINQLKPKTFDYKLTQYPQMALPQGLQYGLVAQDVHTVIPAIVGSARHPETKVGSTTYPAFTYSTVEYTQLIPVLIRAVQQLSAQNHKLDSLVTALTQTVSVCCSNSAARQTGINGNDVNALTQINVNLSDIDMIVLDQNKPNPFAEQTTITYNVPEKYGFAQIVFKTVEGKIIKTVDITKKGRGQINVFASDLSNGLYMYSLIVDGTTVDTKKMVKQN